MAGFGPLSLDVYDVREYPEPEPEPRGTREDTRPRREDFDSVEAYLEAKKRDRIARGLETKRRNREARLKAIPDHIKAIAEARRQHPTLSLWKFSQFLFDAGIYRSGRWGRYPGKPLNSQTLSGWLRLAREAGLLPETARPKPKKPQATA